MKKLLCIIALALDVLIRLAGIETNLKTNAFMRLVVLSPNLFTSKSLDNGLVEVTSMTSWHVGGDAMDQSPWHLGWCSASGTRLGYQANRPTLCHCLYWQSPSSVRRSYWSSSAVPRRYCAQLKLLPCLFSFEICGQRYILISREAHSKNYLLWNNNSRKRRPNVCRACSIRKQTSIFVWHPTEKCVLGYTLLRHCKQKSLQNIAISREKTTLFLNLTWVRRIRIRSIVYQ